MFYHFRDFRTVDEVETVLVNSDLADIAEEKPECDPAFELKDEELEAVAQEHFHFVESQYSQYSAQIQVCC